MEKIILSADSTCDLGQELKARYDVHYYPFHIILDEKDYQDNVDITVKEIFAAYYDHKALPRTAAINVSEYLDYFQDWVKAGYDVIHLNLGGAISSAHKNCVLAARELEEAGAPGKIYPIDSFSLSTGIALQVIDAGDMIKAGLPAGEIAQKLEQNRPNVHASFILDTLDFMRAGGRCSAVAAVGANLLSLKPCIEVNNSDGSMHVGKKYRGNLRKVLKSYVKDKLAQYPNIKREHIFITYSSIEPELEALVRDTIQETMAFGEIHSTKASCTIASHCGPNTLGILFETRG
ncbi:MAG: DegV family protein [Acutalibacter sp.]|jgi:DegV family protein with EDD domain|nr:DegV family protein [Acutalibacter sp.]